MFMFTTLSFMRFFHKPEIKNILSFSLLKSHNHKQSITCLICPLQFFLTPHKRCIFNKKFKLHFSQSPIWIAEKKTNLPLFQILSFHFFLQILLWKWFQWKLGLSTPCHLRHFYCSFPPSFPPPSPKAVFELEGKKLWATGCAVSGPIISLPHT